MAAAGPASNLALAVLIAAFWRVGLLKGMPPGVMDFVLVFMSINVALCLFNLIPLAPLDGGGVLNGLVGEQGARVLAPLQTYGPILLMGLFMLRYISPRFDVMGGLLAAGWSGYVVSCLGS